MLISMTAPGRVFSGFTSSENLNLCKEILRERERQYVDVCVSVFPICAVEDKFTWTLVGEEGQHDAGDVGLAEWVTVEKYSIRRITNDV